MRQFAVIGLGAFGGQVARTLMEKGAEVLVIDSDPAKVEAVKGEVTEAIRADATSEETLADTGVRDVDAVVVAMGKRMEAAILCTAVLHRLGAGYIVARASSELYAQILKDVGADRTVLIEEQMADQVAKSLFAPDIVEQITLSSGHSLVELKPGRHLVGRKLGELHLRRNFRVNVIAIKKRVPKVTDEGETVFEEQTNDLPGPEDRVEQEDVLVVVGDEKDIERLASGRTEE